MWGFKPPRDGAREVAPLGMDGGDSSGAGSWGTPELLHQSVVQNAVYDMDIKVGFGVLRHQWIGLARWSLLGWTELAS